MPTIMIGSFFLLVIIGQVEPKWLLYAAGLLTLAMAGWYLFSNYSIYIVAR